jgi:hypothetical protein
LIATDFGKDVAEMDERMKMRNLKRKEQEAETKKVLDD